MKVVVSPAAEADLADIYDDTYAAWEETQAADTIDTLVARFKWLAVKRSLWQPRDDLRPGPYGRTEAAT